MVFEIISISLYVCAGKFMLFYRTIDYATSFFISFFYISA